MPGSFRCAAIRLRRAKASSGINCPVEHSRSAITSPLASPTSRLIVFRSRHGLLAFPSLYWGRAEEEGRGPPSVQSEIETRPPGRWGNADRSSGTGPTVRISNPCLSPRGAGRAVGGIRALGAESWPQGQPVRDSTPIEGVTRTAARKFARARPRLAISEPHRELAVRIRQHREPAVVRGRVRARTVGLPPMLPCCYRLEAVR